MPCSKASWTSPGVATPGIRGMPLLWPALARDSCSPGLMAKNRACVFDGFELFRVGNRTRADDGVGHFFGNQADGIEADRGAQGDFEGGDAAFDKGVGQIDGGA